MFENFCLGFFREIFFREVYRENVMFYDHSKCTMVGRSCENLSNSFLFLVNVCPDFPHIFFSKKEYMVNMIQLPQKFVHLKKKTFLRTIALKRQTCRYHPKYLTTISHNFISFHPHISLIVRLRRNKSRTKFSLCCHKCVQF